MFQCRYACLERSLPIEALLQLTGEGPMCADGALPLLQLGDVVNCDTQSDCPIGYYCAVRAVRYGACCPEPLRLQQVPAEAASVMDATGAVRALPTSLGRL